MPPRRDDQPLLAGLLRGEPQVREQAEDLRKEARGPPGDPLEARGDGPPGGKLPRLARDYVYSNSKVERIFSSFYYYFFQLFLTFRKQISEKIQQFSLRNLRTFKNLGDFDLFWKNAEIIPENS